MDSLRGGLRRPRAVVRSERVARAVRPGEYRFNPDFLGDRDERQPQCVESAMEGIAMTGMTRLIVGFVLVLVGIAGPAVAADVFSACSKNTTNKLRASSIVVNATAVCKSTETMRTWSDVTLFGTNTNTAVAGNGATCTLGEIILSAGPIANGVAANGQLLMISQRTALFDLIGTLYGGDGVTTFGLPDLRAAAPNGLTYSICDLGVFPSGR